MSTKRIFNDDFCEVTSKNVSELVLITRRAAQKKSSKTLCRWPSPSRTTEVHMRQTGERSCTGLYFKYILLRHIPAN